jgi:hypothetical protein
MHQQKRKINILKVANIIKIIKGSFYEELETIVSPHPTPSVIVTTMEKHG